MLCWAGLPRCLMRQLALLLSGHTSSCPSTLSLPHKLPTNKHMPVVQGPDQLQWPEVVSIWAPTLCVHAAAHAKCLCSKTCLQIKRCMHMFWASALLACIQSRPCTLYLPQKFRQLSTSEQQRLQNSLHDAAASPMLFASSAAELSESR